MTHVRTNRSLQGGVPLGPSCCLLDESGLMNVARSSKHVHAAAVPSKARLTVIVEARDDSRTLEHPALYAASVACSGPNNVNTGEGTVRISAKVGKGEITGKTGRATERHIFTHTIPASPSQTLC